MGGRTIKRKKRRINAEGEENRGWVQTPAGSETGGQVQNEAPETPKVNPLRIQEDAVRTLCDGFNMDRATLSSLRNRGDTKFGYLFRATTKGEAIRNEEEMHRALGRRGIPIATRRTKKRKDRVQAYPTVVHPNVTKGKKKRRQIQRVIYRYRGRWDKFEGPGHFTSE